MMTEQAQLTFFKVMIHAPVLIFSGWEDSRSRSISVLPVVSLIIALLLINLVFETDFNKSEYVITLFIVGVVFFATYLVSNQRIGPGDFLAMSSFALIFNVSVLLIVFYATLTLSFFHIIINKLRKMSWDVELPFVSYLSSGGILGYAIIVS